MLSANFRRTYEFVSSASYRKSRLVNKLILFSRTSTTRAKTSLKNQGTLTLIRVSLI